MKLKMPTNQFEIVEVIGIFGGELGVKTLLEPGFKEFLPWILIKLLWSHDKWSYISFQANIWMVIGMRNAFRKRY